MKPQRVRDTSPTLLDLIATNNESLKQKISVSGFLIMLVHAAARTKLNRPPPKIVRIRNFEHSNQKEFVQSTPWSVCSAFFSPVDSYWAWLIILNDICDMQAPYKGLKLRLESLPWINANIRNKMNLYFKTLHRAWQTNYPEIWAQYRCLKKPDNDTGHDVHNRDPTACMDVGMDVHNRPYSLYWSHYPDYNNEYRFKYWDNRTFIEEISSK